MTENNNNIPPIDDPINYIPLKGKKSKTGERVENVPYRDVELVNQEYFSSSKARGNFSNLSHSLDNFYSEEFLKQLEKKVGPYDQFRKKNKKNRKKWQQAINALFSLENHYKYFHTKVKHKSSPLLNILHIELKNFKKEYRQALSENSPKKNVQRKFFQVKIGAYLRHLFTNESIVTANLNDSEKEILKSFDFVQIIKNISVSEIFLLLCSCSVRIAYKNIYFGDSIEPLQMLGENFGESHLSIKRSDLRQVFKYRLIYLLISKTAELLEQRLKDIAEPILNRNDALLKLLCSKRDELEKQQTAVSDPTELAIVQKQIDDVKRVIETTEIPLNYSLVKTTAILTEIRKNKLVLELENDFNYLESGVVSILDIFSSTVPLRIYNNTSKNQDGRVLTSTFLVLPTGLNDLYSFSDHLPKLVEPDDWSNEGYSNNQELVKYIHMGYSSVNYDKRTINSINVTQKKKFKINEIFLNILKELDNGKLEDTEKLNLPFPTKAKIKTSEFKLERLPSNLNLPKTMQTIIGEIFELETKICSFLKSEYNVSKIWRSLISSLSPLDQIKLLEHRRKTKEFSTLKLKRQTFNSMVKCADIFSKFPLYFDTFTDYRGRLYPGNYLFSRTTGFYKYLVTDYDKRKLTIRGYYHLLSAYFKNCETTQNKLNEILEQNSGIEEKKVFKIFDKFFLENNEIYLKPEKNILYFLLLEDELQKLQKNKYKTNICIEIDQTGSHAVFTSLLLGNKSMAEESNLIGKQKKDVNQHLMNKIESFIEASQMEEKEQEKKKQQKKKNKQQTSKKKEEDKIGVKWEEFPPRLIETLKNNRKCHKLIFMTYNYSQGPKNRAKKLVEIVREFHPNLSNLEIRCLYKLGYSYTKFLDFCFPKFKEQLEKFTACYEVFSGLSHSTSIKTLDGSVFNWTFYFELQHTGTRYNPISGKNENFKQIRPFTMNSYKEMVSSYNKQLKALAESMQNLPDNSETKLELQKKHKECLNGLKSLQESAENLQNRKERVFRPGLVHSIDGAVIRILILKMYEKYDYHINHVHDSIQSHPNYIDFLYQEIDELYNKDINGKDLFDLFLSPSMELLSEQNKSILKTSALEFQSIRDKFKLNVHSPNMYPYE